MTYVRGACSLSALGVVAIAGIYYYYKVQKKRKLPENWVEVGKVTKLFIYPLKSGRRTELQTARCSTFGFVTGQENELNLRDRSFLVYKEDDHEFRTARTYPNLVLIESGIHDKEHVFFDAPDQRPLYVKVPNPDKAEKTYITLHFGEKIDTIDCGDEAAAWFSRFLLNTPTGLRLGYHDSSFQRNIKKSAEKFVTVYNKLTSDSMGMYSDLTSYLLINEKSINELNSELEEPISANNFRPNILIKGDGAPAFAEEDWDWIKIGDVVFKNVKPCTRCVLTTINPDTGVRSSEREPLKTLERVNVLRDPNYVKLDGRAPVMGIHLGLKKAGILNSGDTVYISVAK